MANPVVYSAGTHQLTYYALHPFELQTADRRPFRILCCAERSCWSSSYCTDDTWIYFASLEDGLAWLLEGEEQS